MADERDETLLALTADIVASHVSNNNVAVSDLPLLIGRVHEALAGLGEAGAPAAPAPTPKVSIRSSVKPDHITCLEDGKKMKMLKRHLMTDHQMTPAEYRAKWNLPASYPTVAPNYAEQRRTLAMKIGLGRKPRGAAAAKRAAPARVSEPKAAAVTPAKPGKPARKSAPKPAPAKRAPRKKAQAPAS